MGECLISIVVTLYNYRQYIGDLMKSVLAQTYKNWELIIVDDCSTDGPASSIANYLEHPMGDRIHYYRFDKNLGYATAKNYGITHSEGTYIVMIDADDMLTPESLSIRKKLMTANPKKLWCHGEAYVTHDRNRDMGEASIRWKRNHREKLIRAGQDLTKTYCHRLIHAQTVMVRPEFHREYGLYDESLRFSADNEMWRRVIRFGEIPAHCWDFVAVYRLHARRMCRSDYKMKHRHMVKRKIIEDVERRYKEGINERNTKLWK